MNTEKKITKCCICKNILEFNGETINQFVIVADFVTYLRNEINKTNNEPKPDKFYCIDCFDLKIQK